MIKIFINADPELKTEIGLKKDKVIKYDLFIIFQI